jgi:hypothetical protein
MSFSSFTGGVNTDFTGLQNYVGQSGLGSVTLSNDAVKAYTDDSLRNANFGTSTNIPDFAGDLLSNSASGGNAAAFTFITAPQEVQYSQGAQVEQVSMFGTNNPPLTVGSLNAGELSLGSAMMEGFTLGKQVQQPLMDLLAMQEVSLDSQNGFVNVNVWSVQANERSYGMYVIENVDIQEEMRDMTGRTTRAMVNVKFREVAAYQVNTGRDQALSKTTGQAAPTQDAKVAAANAAQNTPAR